MNIAEFILGLVDAVGLTASILSMFWVYRNNKTLKSTSGAFSVVAFIFALWHFVLICNSAEALSQAHEIGTGLFLIIAVAMNTYNVSSSQINISINRRINDDTTYKVHHADRRSPATALRK